MYLDVITVRPSRPHSAGSRPSSQSSLFARLHTSPVLLPNLAHSNVIGMDSELFPSQTSRDGLSNSCKMMSISMSRRQRWDSIVERGPSKSWFYPDGKARATLRRDISEHLAASEIPVSGSNQESQQAPSSSSRRRPQTAASSKPSSSTPLTWANIIEVKDSVPSQQLSKNRPKSASCATRRHLDPARLPLCPTRNDKEKTTTRQLLAALRESEKKLEDVVHTRYKISDLKRFA